MSPNAERLRILRLATPIMLAQVAVAATGVVDTAVMGRFGDKHDLAAVGAASATIALLYWGFGFLRMATTGLTAQASGAGEQGEVAAVLQRGLLMGGAFGLLMGALLPLLGPVLLLAYGLEPQAYQGAVAYLNARALGGPAALMGFVVMGWLLGRGRTRALLGFQVVLNLTNVVLDATFVGAFDLGPGGIGLGTAIAEWTALFVGALLVRPGLVRVDGILDRTRLSALFQANRDIAIRTIALLLGFAWFVRAGNRYGSAVAGGNEVLLQFITVSAFVLDAFAFVAEKETGEALGAREPGRLRSAIARTTEWSAASAVVFVFLFATTGSWAIQALVADPEARRVALRFLPYTALAPLLGFASWQLDGILLGALRGRALRNAALLSACLYIAVDLALRPWGNHGLWVAFLGFYLLRAGFLVPALIELLRDSSPRTEEA